MPTRPTRGSVREVAALIGRSETAVRGYIKQTTTSPDLVGTVRHPLGLEAPTSGLTLDVEKTRAYAESRPKGRPSQWTEQGA